MTVTHAPSSGSQASAAVAASAADGEPARALVDVEFVSPMPGLSPYTSFRLEPIAGADGLHALRAAAADVRLFLLDARSGDLGYEPVLPREAREEIGAGEADELRVFVVVNPSDGGVFVNLRAPIIVHADTGSAAQVILEDQTYPIRALLGD